MSGYHDLGWRVAFAFMYACSIFMSVAHTIYHFIGNGKCLLLMISRFEGRVALAGVA